MTPQKFAGGGLFRLLNPALRQLRSAGRPALTAEGLELGASPLGSLSVVKPKGGNWLTGSVEGALQGLKKTTLGARTPEELSAMLDLPVDQAASQWSRPDAALNSWIDKQLTRYVKNQMRSEEHTSELQSH